MRKVEAADVKNKKRLLKLPPQPAKSSGLSLRSKYDDIPPMIVDSDDYSRTKAVCPPTLPLTLPVEIRKVSEPCSRKKKTPVGQVIDLTLLDSPVKPAAVAASSTSGCAQLARKLAPPRIRSTFNLVKSLREEQQRQKLERDQQLASSEGSSAEARIAKPKTDKREEERPGCSQSTSNPPPLSRAVRSSTNKITTINQLMASPNTSFPQGAVKFPSSSALSHEPLLPKLKIVTYEGMKKIVRSTTPLPQPSSACLEALMSRATLAAHPSTRTASVTRPDHRSRPSTTTTPSQPITLTPNPQKLTQQQTANQQHWLSVLAKTMRGSYVAAPTSASEDVAGPSSAAIPPPYNDQPMMPDLTSLPTSTIPAGQKISLPNNTRQLLHVKAIVKPRSTNGSGGGGEQQQPLVQPIVIKQYKENNLMHHQITSPQRPIFPKPLTNDTSEAQVSLATNFIDSALIRRASTAVNVRCSSPLKQQRPVSIKKQARKSKKSASADSSTSPVKSEERDEAEATAAIQQPKSTSDFENQNQQSVESSSQVSSCSSKEVPKDEQTPAEGYF